MKKLMIFAALVLLSQFAKAQATLTIDNSTDGCGVYVTMHGADYSVGDAPCATYSRTIYLYPYTSISWATFAVFYPNWLSIYATPTAAHFYWSDVTFQYNCNGGCSDAGGSMSDNSMPPTHTSCFGAGYTWTDGCKSATWTDATPGMIGSTVTLKF